MALVLDLTSEVAAYGTRLLAEMGHDVVRIESPEGDSLRHMGPHLRGVRDLESGAPHQFFNAGKRSCVFDFNDEAAKTQFIALVQKADAVVASMPLPIDRSTLLSVNANLVLVEVDDGLLELLAYARSGLMAITGIPESSPVILGGHIPLAAIGVYVALAATSALFSKHMTGRGQVVEVSSQQCLNALCEQVLIEFAATGNKMERHGARGGITAVAGAVRCADGYWMVSVPPNKQGWGNLIGLIEDPVLADDATLEQEAARHERKDFILDRIEAWSSTHKRDDLVSRAQQHHIPAAPVTGPLDLVQDPQLAARGFLRELQHPRFGKMSYPVGALAPLWHTAPRPAPRLGEHTAEIQKEVG